jgi:hypothetical protein
MASTNPREWIFQGWIGLRSPWAFDQQAVARVGNGVLAEFPNMSNFSYDAQEGKASFKEYREGSLHAELSLSPNNVFFTGFSAERAEEWKHFNTSVVRLLSEQTDIFAARFNISMAQQSIVIPFRGVREAGKRLFEVVGNTGFFPGLASEVLCEDIGLDNEFVFPVSGKPGQKLRLRFQTRGQSATWILPDQIWLSLSAVLDPEPKIVGNIQENWQSAQEALFQWLTETIHPKVITKMNERLR